MSRCVAGQVILRPLEPEAGGINPLNPELKIPSAIC